MAVEWTFKALGAMYLLFSFLFLVSLLRKKWRWATPGTAFTIIGIPVSVFLLTVLHNSPGPKFVGDGFSNAGKIFLLWLGIGIFYAFSGTFLLIFCHKRQFTWSYPRRSTFDFILKRLFGTKSIFTITKLLVLSSAVSLGAGVLGGVIYSYFRSLTTSENNASVVPDLSGLAFSCMGTALIFFLIALVLGQNRIRKSK